MNSGAGPTYTNANVLSIGQLTGITNKKKNLTKKRQSMSVGARKSKFNPFNKSVYTQQNLNTVNAEIAGLQAKLNKSRSAQQYLRNQRMASMMKKPAAVPAMRKSRKNRRSTRRH